MSVSFFDRLEQQAKSDPKAIAFPEADNEMILRAACELVKLCAGKPTLIGNPQEIQTRLAEYGLSADGIQVFDNTDPAACESIAAEFSTKYSDLSEKSVLRKIKNPLNCAMFLTRLNHTDCVAAGRSYTTADVIIAAQSILGLKDGSGVVSSLGIVNAPNFNGSEGGMLAIADCAINPFPSADELADIAINSADTVSALMGWEPRVAMLSFSTCGSSEHESIDIIRASIDIVRTRRPNLKIDGEFQMDTAILPAVAKKKVPYESAVAGKANILIFPNLHAGNIGVKLIQIFGGADAYGPVLQGFAYPVCDFSRSAPLSEMLGNILILLVRAQKEGRNV